MQAVIILDAIKEIDTIKSVTATVKALASGTAFTSQEVVDALIAAHQDEESEIERMTPRILSSTTSNRMMSASLFLADETASGYVRR